MIRLREQLWVIDEEEKKTSPSKAQFSGGEGGESCGISNFCHDTCGFVGTVFVVEHECVSCIVTSCLVLGVLRPFFWDVCLGDSYKSMTDECIVILSFVYS